MTDTSKQIERLLGIMRSLRDPEKGCPWDIRQDFASIAPYTIEEAYEVADAIEREDIMALRDELGDLLFQVVFHAQMADEQGRFGFGDVVESICDKLVRRHPHVFGDVRVDDEAELHRAWEEHKKDERKRKQAPEESQGILSGIASTLPALQWSAKLQKRAAHHGFDWSSIEPVFDKIHEEIEELKAEIARSDNSVRINEEMGDVLFACVNLARHCHVDAEHALRDSNRRFIKRFEAIEAMLGDEGRRMEDCGLAELEAYWQKAKRETGG
jgi:MazG family protein